MRRKKDTAHRPSQSHMEYVTTKDGRKVRNTAFVSRHNNGRDKAFIKESPHDFFSASEDADDMDQPLTIIEDAIDDMSQDILPDFAGNILQRRLKYIHEYNNHVMPLEENPEAVEAVRALEHIVDLASEGANSDNLHKMRAIIDDMPAAIPQLSWDFSTSARTHDRDNITGNIKSLAMVQYHVLLGKYVDDNMEFEAPERERNSRLIGTNEAQKVLAAGDTDFMKTSTITGTDFQEVINMASYDGNNIPSVDTEIFPGVGVYELDGYISPQKEMAMFVKNSQSEYLWGVFPDKELRKRMEELELDNVSVTGVINGREKGLAYTVNTPSGNTRTFMVYEHRNTDSIIINGKTNWDSASGELPYVSDDKYQYFSEIPCENYGEAADQLVYFLKLAQSGELEDDNELMHKASHIDWVARLSDTLGAPYDDYLMRTSPEEYDRISKIKNGKQNDDEILQSLDFD